MNPDQAPATAAPTTTTGAASADDQLDLVYVHLVDDLPTSSPRTTDHGEPHRDTNRPENHLRADKLPITKAAPQEGRRPQAGPRPRPSPLPDSRVMAVSISSSRVNLRAGAARRAGRRGGNITSA